MGNRQKMVWRGCKEKNVAVRRNGVDGFVLWGGNLGWKE